MNAEEARVGATDNDLHKLPTIKTKKEWTKKVKPGISTFGSKPEAVGPQHLKELFEHAEKVIPEEDIEVTPIFLLATAGVRLLPDRQRQELLSNVCTYTKKNTRFLLPECSLQIQAISGETEGLYGWLAANYLLGGFNDPYTRGHGSGHHTYGFLDLGGASAQIAFAPNETETEKHGNDLHTLRLRTLDGVSKEYQVFVTTWLGYGVNEARTKYTTDLLSHVDVQPQAEIPDPCLPAGMTKDVDKGVELPKHADRPPHYIGTGKFSECLSATYPLLHKEAACPDEPCLFNGVHVPAIDFDVNHFVGISEYWHTTHDIFEMGHKDRAYDFETYQRRVSEFCSQDWSHIEADVAEKKYGEKVDKDTAGALCFKASWLINMLHEGVGIPRVGLEASPVSSTAAPNTTSQMLNSAKQEGYLAPFQAVNKIDNTEVSWTLGKMVLYASSMVPAADESTSAVGFGKNTPTSSKPDSAGSRPDSSLPLSEVSGPGSHHATTNDAYGGSSSHLESGGGTGANGWRQQLIHHPHRTPGLLFILLIVLIAVILLCGRERRQTFLRKLLPFSRRLNPHSPAPSSSRRSTLAKKLGLARSSENKYGRLEEGDYVSAAADFELGALSASSSDAGSEGEAPPVGGSARHSTTSGSSGRKRFQTPRSGTMSPRRAPYSSPSAGSVAGVHRTASGYFEGVGLGLSGAGAGFSEHRGSRERLAPGALTMDGRRSRGTSPVRARSPLAGQFKEAVD